ncbi:hypothetical protein JD844_033342 [Phrynosoma platyrhinos]|uniref:interstitial collagenase n=1 Tax=Phrynosoma platyrhinos TaxID=52577 RepID=A0ABQ7T6E9_PHRPL|nr:hypothetical protein JD844_033342 [Phrynosoma platyrhinos]
MGKEDTTGIGRMKYLSVLLLSFASCILAAPVGLERKDVDMNFVKKYLNNYYSSEDEAIAPFYYDDNVTLTEKLKKMQQFFGLEVTGKPDSETLAVMKKARCGVPDLGTFTLTEGNPKWKRTNITYSKDLGQTRAEGVAEQPLWASWPAGITSPTLIITLTGEDDIDGIQAIYGKLDNPVQPTGPTTPKACDPRTTFDAVASIRGEMLFFKGRQFWRKHPQLDVELYFIALFWPNLPSRIEAAYENYEKDQLYGYPKTIYHLGFPKTVKKIDAAFSDPESGKTYFFVGNKYWRYDEIRQTMETGYPKNIAQKFRGVGPKIDAALQHDGYIYFFQGTKVLQFNPKSQRVQSVQRSNTWLNC